MGRPSVQLKREFLILAEFENLRKYKLSFLQKLYLNRKGL